MTPPTSNPKSTKDDRFEETKRVWEGARRGTGGLRSVRFFDFEDLPAVKKKELLTEPFILTADGVETCVVMTVEMYFGMLQMGQFKWGALCKQIDDIIFRQVV